MSQNLPEWLYQYSDIIVVILIFLAICGVFLFVYNIIKYFYQRHVRKIYKKVARISKNFEQLKRLSVKHDMKPLSNYNRSIVVSVRSLQKFRKTSGEDVIGYYIEQNVDKLRDDVALAIKTLQHYKAYVEEVRSLDFETDKTILKQEKLSYRKFKKYEQKLVKFKTVKNPSSISARVSIRYSSPRGRNVYQKTGKYGYSELVYIYRGWSKKRDYRISAKYERSLMSDSLRYDVLKRDNFQCCICGASRKDGAKLHVDHIVPVSKGGKTMMSNLQTLCERCNLGKSNKL